MAFLRTVIRCSANKKYGFLVNNLQNGRINFKQTVVKSTATGTIVQENTSSSAVGTSPKDPLDITFEDAKAAFKSKTNWELLRAYIVYTLCSFEYLVDNNMQVRFSPLFITPSPSYCRYQDQSYLLPAE